MHILFTLCKIGDRGGCLNHLMKNQADMNIQVEGEAYPNQES